MQEGQPPLSSPGGPRFFTGRPTYSINPAGQARPIEPRTTVSRPQQSRQESLPRIGASSPSIEEEIEPDPSGILRRVWASLSSQNHGGEGSLLTPGEQSFRSNFQEEERLAVFSRTLVRFAVSSALATLAHLRLRVVQDDFAEEPSVELLRVLTTLQRIYLDAYLAYRGIQQEYNAALRRYAYAHGLPRSWHLR